MTSVTAEPTPRPKKTATATFGVVLLLVFAVVISGCGNSKSSSTASPAVQIAAAAKVNPATFPQTDGKKTFSQIISQSQAKQNTATITPAANDFVAGRVNRIPFGLFDLSRNFIWGPTVIYIAQSAGSPAIGPFAVAAHSLDVPAKYRSKTSASDYKTIGNGFYAAVINAGNNVSKFDLLTLTRTSKGLISATAGITLAPQDPAPAPGDKAPSIVTPTLASVHGDVSKIDTRVPPDDMHKISLNVALKTGKPTVLIFATPALCASRVCGPVVDVASEVEQYYRGRVNFIHQEIYNDNDINKGYRKQVRQYGLTAEPFTFVINGKGIVVAQLQGPFVAQELEAALAKAGAKI